MNFPPAASPYTPPTAVGRSSRPSPGRPGAVTALAVLDVVMGLILLLVGGLLVLVLSQMGGGGDVTFVILAAVVVLMGLLSLVAAVGLFRLSPYGRIAQMLLAGLNLLSIPLGTIFGVLVLLYFRRPGVARLFSGAPQDLSPEEEEQVEGTGVIVAAVVMLALVVVALLGIVAAIAIPSLLSARVAANERSVLSDLQALYAYEEAYARQNGGFYDTPECLAAPARCIPRPGVTEPGTAAFVTPTRSGYTFQFHPGPPPADAPSNVSPSSVTAYAYVASPTQAGRSGIRAFCIDSAGHMCTWREGRVPPIQNGACPTDCAFPQ